MDKFRDIFHPSPERLLENYEFALEIHNNNIGKCSTCKYIIPPPPDLPGFVTDYGECKLCKDIFPSKVCGLDDVDCDGYEEDIDSIVGIVEEINRLKGEIEHGKLKRCERCGKEYGLDVHVVVYEETK